MSGEPDLNLDAEIYLPSDLELMAARGAICSYIYSIADGSLEPRTDVMDAIAQAVVVSMRWRPQRAVGTPTENTP